MIAERRDDVVLEQRLVQVDGARAQVGAGLDPAPRVPVERNATGVGIGPGASGELGLDLREPLTRLGLGREAAGRTMASAVGRRVARLVAAGRQRTNGTERAAPAHRSAPVPVDVTRRLSGAIRSRRRVIAPSRAPVDHTQRVCQRTRRYASSGDPVRDVDGIEAHEAADLDVRNPALRDESSHVSLRDAQTFRHRTDVQQRRELVHIPEWRVESRKRDQKLRVKPSSHTLHHAARITRETVAKIGTDMPVALSATGRLSAWTRTLRFEIRDCFTITGRSTVVTGRHRQRCCAGERRRRSRSQRLDSSGRRSSASRWGTGRIPTARFSTVVGLMLAGISQRSTWPRSITSRESAAIPRVAPFCALPVP